MASDVIGIYLIDARSYSMPQEHGLQPFRFMICTQQRQLPLFGSSFGAQWADHRRSNIDPSVRTTARLHTTRTMTG